MKRAICTILLGLMLSITSIAQKTVAVYVTSSEDVSQATKRILGSELVSAITKTNDYVAIERTADFMAQVSQEQGHYEIDDATLYNLGKKFGASNVCVADITKFGDDYYIVARILDIKTSKVWKTSRAYSKLTSLKELIETSESLADELFGNTKEFSTYAYGDNIDNNSFIIKIENRGNYTNVSMKYVSSNPYQRLGINRNTYIEDMATHKRYNLIDAANVNLIDQDNKEGKMIGDGIWNYSLFFERISEETQNIKIVEPNGREYKDVILKPYGEADIFVFEDKTSDVYRNLQINDYKKQRDIEKYGEKLVFARSSSSKLALDGVALSKEEAKELLGEKDYKRFRNTFRYRRLWNYGFPIVGFIPIGGLIASSNTVSDDFTVVTCVALAGGITFAYIKINKALSKRRDAIIENWNKKNDVYLSVVPVLNGVGVRLTF